MNGNSQIEQIIERDGSIKAGDRIAYNGAGALTIQILPGIFTAGPLPQNLPAGVWEKDAMLLKTLRAESFWRAAVGIAVSKYASKGWEIESDIPLRRKRALSAKSNRSPLRPGIPGSLPEIPRQSADRQDRKDDRHAARNREVQVRL